MDIEFVGDKYQHRLALRTRKANYLTINAPHMGEGWEVDLWRLTIPDLDALMTAARAYKAYLEADQLAEKQAALETMLTVPQ